MNTQEVYFYLAVILLLHLFRHYWGPNFIHSVFNMISRLKGLQVQAKKPELKQIKKEKKNIFLSQYVDLFILTLCIGLYSLGFTKIYLNFDNENLLFSIISFLFLFFIHDCYFYITHRAMHIPWFYKKVHIVHHRSITTSAYTSFSVHPVEKFIELLFYPIIITAMPLNLMLLLLFVFISSVINIMGHSGYELRRLTRFMNKLPLFHSTCVFHIMHHRYPNSNFSLYYIYLDKLFGTQHKEYESEYLKQI